MNTSDGRCAPHTLLRCTPYPAIHWRVRVPQMPGIQNPCKCPTSEHQIKFRHPPCVPKARKEPSRCLFLRNWPENICDDRSAFSRVHMYRYKCELRNVNRLDRRFMKIIPNIPMTWRNFAAQLQNRIVSDSKICCTLVTRGEESLVTRFPVPNHQPGKIGLAKMPSFKLVKALRAKISYLKPSGFKYDIFALKALTSTINN